MYRKFVTILLAQSIIQATRLTFDLRGIQEECFYEALDARSTSNLFLFRYTVLEPERYDSVDVKIKSPSGKIIKSWEDSKSEHLEHPCRENGLHMFCFKRREYSKKMLKIFFVIDFISTGSRTLSNFPSLVGYVSKQTPDNLYASYLDVMKDQSMGVLNFNLEDMSEGLLHENTRVMILLSTEYAETDEQDISLIEVPEKEFSSTNNRVSWNSLRGIVSQIDSLHPVAFDEATTGAGIYFDVTDVMFDAIQEKRKSIGFVIATKEASKVRIYGMAHASPDHWPTLVFEDMGIETMSELAEFKEVLFQLRGDLAHIILKERLSRDAAESTNSRVKWMSLMINLALVSVALGQVFYVRHLLETNY